MTRTGNEGNLVVLYDGVCGLCNRLNRFILKRDIEGRIRFARLQGEFARELLARHGRTSDDLDTVVVVEAHATEREELFTKSKAVLRILTELPGHRLWAAFIRFLPTALADFGYDLVARSRYFVFGRHDTCPVPRPDERGRFIET